MVCLYKLKKHSYQKCFTLFKRTQFDVKNLDTVDYDKWYKQVLVVKTNLTFVHPNSNFAD